MKRTGRRRRVRNAREGSKTRRASRGYRRRRLLRRRHLLRRRRLLHRRRHRLCRGRLFSLHSRLLCRRHPRRRSGLPFPPRTGSFAWKLASKISSHARNVPSPSRRRSRRATPTTTTRSSPRRSERRSIFPRDAGGVVAEAWASPGTAASIARDRGGSPSGSRGWRRTRTDGRTSGASTPERRRAGVRRVGRVAREDAQRRRRRGGEERGEKNRRRTTRRRRRRGGRRAGKI